jgi:arsenate reductase
MVQSSPLRNVLFLCTGNSCRSQMAEAIVNDRLFNQWKAFSAGTEPTGYVHPIALEVLEEIGITHHGWSKNVSNFKDQEFDLVMTICDSAAENCPIWLRSGQQVHISFVDPASLEGDDHFILSKFREVRDEIEEKIPAILANY